MKTHAFDFWTCEYSDLSQQGRSAYSWTAAVGGPSESAIWAVATATADNTFGRFGAALVARELQTRGAGLLAAAASASATAEALADAIGEQLASAAEAEWADVGELSWAIVCRRDGRVAWVTHGSVSIAFLEDTDRGPRVGQPASVSPGVASILPDAAAGLLVVAPALAVPDAAVIERAFLHLGALDICEGLNEVWSTPTKPRAMLAITFLPDSERRTDLGAFLHWARNYLKYDAAGQTLKLGGDRSGPSPEPPRTNIKSLPALTTPSPAILSATPGTAAHSLSDEQRAALLDKVPTRPQSSGAARSGAAGPGAIPRRHTSDQDETLASTSEPKPSPDEHAGEEDPMHDSGEAARLAPEAAPYHRRHKTGALFDGSKVKGLTLSYSRAQLDAPASATLPYAEKEVISVDPATGAISGDENTEPTTRPATPAEPEEAAEARPAPAPDAELGEQDEVASNSDAAAEAGHHEDAHHVHHHEDTLSGAQKVILAIAILLALAAVAGLVIGHS